MVLQLHKGPAPTTSKGSFFVLADSLHKNIVLKT